MIDLFSMFLNRAIGWGVGRILDTIVSCPICGQRDVARIGNVRSNYLECSNCHRQNEQFTNACDFTVNRTTHEIGHALFEPGTHWWEWVDESGFFDPRNDRLRIPFNIRLKGLRDRSVVFQTELRRYSDNRLIISHSTLLTPEYDNTTWSDYWHSFGEGSFTAEDKGIVAVDAKILSEYRDVLFEDRRLVAPWE